LTIGKEEDQRYFYYSTMSGIADDNRTNNRSNNINNAPNRWKDNPNVYPPFEEIVEALQDPGKEEKKVKKKKEVTYHRFPLIEKLALKVYKNILVMFNKPEGLTVNTSRGKVPLYQAIVLQRKHMDVNETPPVFHGYGKDGKVFAITTSTVHGGLDIAIERFQDHVLAQVHQKNTARTPNDGIRLGCIMLDPKYRESVSGVLSKKKGRKKSDIPGDPTTHFFEHVLTDAFSNRSYIVGHPPHYEDFPEEEKGKWEPNDSAIFENERNGEWLRATWDEYLKPKYKDALKKWNKDTGGGDGTPPSFIDFCAGDRWLVWIFCLDHAANFLLASSAGGKMPNHLQVEAGFAEELSSMGGSDETTSAQAVEDELRAAKKQRLQVATTMEKVVEYLESKDKKESPGVDKYIRQVADYSQMMVDSTVLNTMTPNSRSVYVDTLKRQRKSVLDKMNADSTD
jgi:hypothetical protein